jgi:hypothetical protein
VNLSAHNARLYLAIAVVSAASFVIMFELSQRLD